MAGTAKKNVTNFSQVMAFSLVLKNFYPIAFQIFLPNTPIFGPPKISSMHFHIKLEPT